MKHILYLLKENIDLDMKNMQKNVFISQTFIIFLATSHFIFANSVDQRYVQTPIMLENCNNQLLSLRNNNSKPRLVSPQKICGNMASVMLNPHHKNHYKISVNGTDVCMQGDNMQILPCNNDTSKNALWKFKQQDNGYSIYNDNMQGPGSKKIKYCLTSNPNNSNLLTQPCVPNYDNQIFKFLDILKTISLIKDCEEESDDNDSSSVMNKDLDCEELSEPSNQNLRPNGYQPNDVFNTNFNDLCDIPIPDEYYPVYNPQFSSGPNMVNNNGNNMMECTVYQKTFEMNPNDYQGSSQVPIPQSRPAMQYKTSSSYMSQYQPSPNYVPNATQVPPMLQTMKIPPQNSFPIGNMVPNSPQNQCIEPVMTYVNIPPQNTIQTPNQPSMNMNNNPCVYPSPNIHQNSTKYRYNEGGNECYVPTPNLGYQNNYVPSMPQNSYPAPRNNYFNNRNAIDCYIVPQKPAMRPMMPSQPQPINFSNRMTPYGNPSQVKNIREYEQQNCYIRPVAQNNQNYYHHKPSVPNYMNNQNCYVQPSTPNYVNNPNGYLQPSTPNYMNNQNCYVLQNKIQPPVTDFTNSKYENPFSPRECIEEVEKKYSLPSEKRDCEPPISHENIETLEKCLEKVEKNFSPPSNVPVTNRMPSTPVSSTNNYIDCAQILKQNPQPQMVPVNQECIDFLPNLTNPKPNLSQPDDKCEPKKSDLTGKPFKIGDLTVVYEGYSPPDPIKPVKNPNKEVCDPIKDKSRIPIGRSGLVLVNEIEQDPSTKKNEPAKECEPVSQPPQQTLNCIPTPVPIQIPGNTVPNLANVPPVLVPKPNIVTVPTTPVSSPSIPQPQNTTPITISIVKEEVIQPKPDTVLSYNQCNVQDPNINQKMDCEVIGPSIDPTTFNPGNNMTPALEECSPTKNISGINKLDCDSLSFNNNDNLAFLVSQIMNHSRNNECEVFAKAKSKNGCVEILKSPNGQYYINEPSSPNNISIGNQECVC